ncbi:penicillin-binding protein 2 [Thiohalophilus thiocyanatoxydans]|uniref:Peptidoglycan D,D-transpeptidase MrdA n=1 Tax=Thiohalophilus thiocyanatoxydans TaxID=381308 RepID=A0A4R8J1X9_9GAMM|nr:penicillin-binding protein 2 [Thiohalophilus thiocyanatoxydans]TDY04337.1 penicillin-binding protein 2 [Thiohalophilus thiocyanatoxydans]
MPSNPQSAFKDNLHETALFNRRLMIAAIVVGILTAVLVTKLFYLQVINQTHYSTLSENNRVNLLPIPPTRGLIHDRNGIVLAQNQPSFTLTLVPEHIPDLDATLEALKQRINLTERDIARFHRYRMQKRRFEGIPLRFRLTDEEVARITVDQYRLPGVEIKAELVRHYPLGELASHAIGYVGRISENELDESQAANYSATSHIGKVGIERYYEEQLHGEVGYQRVETNAQGRILRVLERTLPKPGKNLYLNIDARLQEVAEESFGDENGALVAMDPNNGAVLAFVSLPTYDPGLFVNGIDSKTYRALTTTLSRPLFNRALRGQYPPGSTLKPFLGLASLETEALEPDHELNCKGWYKLKNDKRRYRDWKEEGHGRTDLGKAITESCDVFFYELSFELGIDNIHKYLTRFGLGQRTGIDILGERPGLVPSREWKRRTRNESWYHGETLITGIGQGFMLATPLQLANITATLSQRGQRQTPRMLYAVQDATNNEFTVQESKPREPIEAIEEQHWQTVIQGMEDVIHGTSGTARGISRGMQYKAAGKTGTSQVFGIAQDEEYVEEDVIKKLRDHGLFISFAPLEDPRIAVAVIVENGGSGSSSAAPIARKVMDHYLLNRDERHEPY